jgi:alpha-glucosidase
MDKSPKSTGQWLAGVRTLGLSLALQAALYPLRRRYYEAKFAKGDPRGSIWQGWLGLLRSPATPDMPTQSEAYMTLGDMIACERSGQSITLHCDNAALQISVLAPDLLRVRLSTSGQFESLQSYAVAKPDQEWPPTPITLLETAESFELRTARLTCRVQKHPCRLTFLDAQGQRIHADSAGAGWRGEQVAHFAKLEAHEHIYGLGEKAFPLERRGHSYELWNIDPQSYPPGADPLYLNIPFYVGLHAGQSYGILYDNTFRARIDAGAAHADELAYVAQGGELRYYLCYGPALDTVLERYTELTGRMPMPPLWALGYQQSRWSYYPEARVREIANLFRQHHIPCDVLHLDIHYMHGYRCFTWDPQRFPDPPSLLRDLHAQGFKVVAMIDCGIKADPDYPVCTQGLRQGMFCTYPDGTPAGGPVWPGECYFPDFTNPNVRQWWGDLYAPLLTAGIDGVWNDMNEPTCIGPGGNTLASCVRHAWEDQGADHRQAHNVYGLEMARASAEGLHRLRPDERPFLFTRSGWAGVQRYATAWTADNQSTWEHLKLTMAMVLGSGLSGLAFTGPDVGGFERGAHGELLVRWTQMAAFLPFFRNHTALLNPGQEPWAFGEPYLSANRAAIEWRYRLLPYLYTAVWQCAQSGLPIARPLVLAYPDDALVGTLDDEFLCGDALLIAPMCQPGATSRQVYLPAGEWFDGWSEKRYSGPATIDVEAPLERIPVFVRAGSALPIWPLMQHTGERPVDVLTWHVFAGNDSSTLYEDDGHSLAYQRGAWRVTRLECQRTSDNGLRITRQTQGNYQPGYARCAWVIHGLDGAPQRVQCDGQDVTNAVWNEQTRTLRVETGVVQHLETFSV